MISLESEMEGSPVWYRFARLAMKDQRIAQHNMERRKPTEERLKHLPYIKENIMSAEELYEYKIEPNLPRGVTLNCSNILDNQPLRGSPRRGLVGFPGSGSSWIRLLIDIATG